MKTTESRPRPGTSTATLGLFSLVCLIIANMVGAGVFTTSGFALGDLGSAHRVIAAWVVGGIIALAGALIAIWPARARRRDSLVRSEGDARKEAKYREIRDAELDHAAGKLSDEDFAALDAELRSEALEILDREGNGNGKGNGNGAGTREPEKVEQG